MILTPVQKSLCERVLNAFETGSAGGDYAAIAIFHDGPHRIRQITYGRSQTTEYGNLQELISQYVNANGLFSAALAPFVSLIGQTPLVDHAQFISLLVQAGSKDPVMKSVQDTFFDARYFTPAFNWAQKYGFQEALSMLVIYDSFIHSNGILPFLRSRFPEVPPANGGNERKWITQYVDVRDAWLATHSNPELHPTVYRTKCLRFEIARGNWDLSQIPINAHGVLVEPSPTIPLPSQTAPQRLLLHQALQPMSRPVPSSNGPSLVDNVTTAKDLSCRLGIKRVKMAGGNGSASTGRTLDEMIWTAGIMNGPGRQPLFPGSCASLVRRTASHIPPRMRRTSANLSGTETRGIPTHCIGDSG